MERLQEHGQKSSHTSAHGSENADFSFSGKLQDKWMREIAGVASNIWSEQDSSMMSGEVFTTKLFQWISQVKKDKVIHWVKSLKNNNKINLKIDKMHGISEFTNCCIKKQECLQMNIDKTFL